jgi:sulfur-oxidizing protein SoxY
MNASSHRAIQRPDRRKALHQATAVFFVLAATPMVTPALAQGASNPVAIAPRATQDAINRFAKSRPVELGRVKLDVSELVENGHAVPVTISVDAQVGDVDAIALFTEENPQPDVAVFNVQRSAKTQVATRMRIAKSQRVWAMARMSDGRCFAQPVQVIVTLAACVEGI